MYLLPLPIRVVLLFRIIRWHHEFLICPRHSKSSEQEQKIERFTHVENILRLTISWVWKVACIRIMNEKPTGFSESCISKIRKGMGTTDTPVISKYRKPWWMDSSMEGGETSSRSYTRSVERQISETNRALFMLGQMACSRDEISSSWQLSVRLLHFLMHFIRNNYANNYRHSMK